MGDYKHIYRGTIGMEKILRQLVGDFQSQTLDSVNNRNNNSNFPFYNIVELHENKYQIIIALAGYSENDFEITQEDRELIVCSDGVAVEPGVKEFIHRGFTSKAFSSKFILGSDIVLTDTEYVNGLLKISLSHDIQESSKKKIIKVGERRDTRTQLNG